jgi:two-component system chemotaxis sensor kinase CheA
MANAPDDEILQDFLIEAGEIHEQLGEQLVELEGRPADKELLNAVFRGFHTIKGGAGFLSIKPMVDVCHRAEDAFNVFRQGDRAIDATVMDVMLQVLDILKLMFADIRNGVQPMPAEQELLDKLEQLTKAPTTEDEAVTTAHAADTDAAGDAGITSGGDEINDEEFEAILDQLHGAGRHRGVPTVATDTPPAASTTRLGAPPSGSPGTQEQSGDITDEEFELLLDRLQAEKSVPRRTVAAPRKEAVLEAVGSMAESAVSARAQAVAAGTMPAREVSNQPKAAVDARQPTPSTNAGPAQQKAESVQQEATIRVDTKRLDDIMNLVGELVLVRNRLSTLRNAINDDEVDKAVSNLDLVTSDLQAAAMKTRMQPIRKVFSRFPRVVRDIARSLRKEVTLELVGEETDLDKNLVEALADPLVHLVRNAVDHGIESPADREAAGKPRMGKIVLSAKHAGDHIQLAIRDDGAGMDPEVIRRKAVEKGAIDADAAARLDERGCFNLIFLPGLSTKEQISEISGRGVGMDVVKNSIGRLSGTIEIDSVKGRGSTITIRVPLTLAILPTLMIMLENRIFALPLASVSEIFDLDLTKTKVVDGQQVVLVRNTALPIFFLQRWLIGDNRGADHGENGHVVVVSIGNQNVGFVVDKLIGQEEVVTKPLGAMLRRTKGFAGATITGDGRIALILDIPGLLSKYGRRR